jgi:hypothetical protein
MDQSDHLCHTVFGLGRTRASGATLENPGGKAPATTIATICGCRIRAIRARSKPLNSPGVTASVKTTLGSFLAKDGGGIISRSSLNHLEPCLFKRIHCYCANVWVSLDNEYVQPGRREGLGVQHGGHDIERKPMRSKLRYTVGQDTACRLKSELSSVSGLMPLCSAPPHCEDWASETSSSEKGLSGRFNLSASIHDKTLVPFKANQGSFRPIPVDTRSDGYVVVQGNI